MTSSILRVCSAVLCAGRSVFKGCRPSNRYFVAMARLLDQVDDVDIDKEGRFKYILIEVTDKQSKENKSIVRGYASAPYHADIFDSVTEGLAKGGGVKAKCLGGGRIEHDPDKKTIKVYGYSQGFGKADHAVTVDLLKKKYTDYNITFSDEGY